MKIYVLATLFVLACNSRPDTLSTEPNADLGVLQEALQGPSPITVPTKFMAGDTANSITVSDTEVLFPRMFAPR